MKAKKLQDSSDSGNEAREQVMELNHNSSRQELTKLGKRVSNVVLPVYNLDT